MPVIEAVQSPNYKRRHHRVTVPLFVSIGGISYRAADWSLGGFRLVDYRGTEKKGAELGCQLILPYANFAVHFQARCRIVRRLESTIGCSFIDLPEAAQRALRHLIEASIEGRLGEVDDAIGVIEAPVPSRELADLLQEEDDTHFYFGRKRMFRKSAAYLAASLATVCALALLVYREARFVEIEAGSVLGNFVSVASRVDGRLAEIGVEEGQPVRAGERLFSLANGDLEEAAAMAQAALEAARTRRDACVRQIAEERERLGLYREVTLRQQEQARAHLRQTEARLDRARIEKRRRAALLAEGLLPETDFELAVQEVRVLEEELEALREGLQIADLNVSATSEGRFFGGQEIEGRVTELREQLRILEAEVSEADQAVRAALRRQEEARVASPVDGVVYTIYRRPGEVLHPRDVVLSIRVDEGLWAVGRLPRDEALGVRPGLRADVLIPSYRLRLDGVVSAVGHQGLSTASQSSADMESSLKEVPVKIQLLDPRVELAPGVRARIIIRKEGWLSRMRSLGGAGSSPLVLSPPQGP